MMDRKDEKKGVGNVLPRLTYVTMIISNINKTMEKIKWMLKCHCAVRAIPGHHTAYLVCLWTVYDVCECVSINLLPSIDISDCKFVYSFSLVHCLCRPPSAASIVWLFVCSNIDRDINSLYIDYGVNFFIILIHNRQNRNYIACHYAGQYNVMEFEKKRNR